MKNRFKWSLLAVIALIATVAMAADKYISSSGNIVLKTATSKSVNLQDTVYATQAGSVGIGISGPQSKLDVYTNQASFAGIRVYNDSSDSAAKGGIGFGDHNGSYQNQIYTNAAGKLFIDNMYTNGMEIRANTTSSPATALAIESTGRVLVGPSGYGSSHMINGGLQISGMTFTNMWAFSGGGLQTVTTLSTGNMFLFYSQPGNYGGADNRHGALYLAVCSNGTGSGTQIAAPMTGNGTFAMSGCSVTYTAGGGNPATTIAWLRLF